MTPTPADTRNAALLSVAAIAAGFLVPALPYVGIPLAGFALGWIAYRFGPGPSVALALASSVLVAALGPTVIGVARLDALFVAAVLLAVGPGTAWALRRYSAYTVVAVGALVVAGAFLLAPLGAQTLKDSLSTWSRILELLAASGSVADPAALRENTGALLTQMKASWPATTVYTMGLSVVLSVPLVSRTARSLGAEVNRYPALAETDLTFHLVWPTIAGLGLLAAGTFWGHGQGVAYVVGLNLLMIVRPALVLQGLGVFAGLYRRIGVGKVMRIVGFVLIGITEMLVPSVSVLGLIDLFLNVRKVARGHGSSASDMVR